MNTKRRRAKNVYSLQSFGHTLSPVPTVAPTARSGHLSADGRRADIQTIPLEREIRVSPAGAPSAVDLDEDNWLDVPSDLDSAPGNTVVVCTTRKRKRRWYATTDEALRHWVHNYRDGYLRALVTREGCMGEDVACLCREPGKYRCRECHGAQLYCKECMVQAHRLRPLCRIEVWNGTFFERRELRHLGLRVQLGHSDNLPCPRALQGREKFVVIAVNGFHHVTLDYCQCRRSGSLPHWEQLLAFGWFPSTPDRPKSAITISTLKLFHAVSLQGKTTVYHFFNALGRITDNTGSQAFQRRYKVILRVVRQWRNLRALKRGGMGNDPDRLVSDTREGELAVECIACPKPGVNLPEGWENTPPAMRFLYAIFLAIDACFRLKRKKISSWAADPSLQDGWAYFVQSAPYAEFVKTLGEQKEMSTCTGLAALDHANTKYSKGYAATGCGMITCGRHEVVSRNGVGDLQNGEKYGNMDYIVASAWRHLRALLFFLLSYDIMCQWSKNLRDRLSKLPPALRFQLAAFFVKYVIPKLHILGHLRKCQENYSLLYTLGAAQADMEGIERIWSSSGLMGASTREMGPGSRQDTLDDFWHFWNWNKVVGMGTTLRKRFLKATKELDAQKSWLEKFSQAHQEEIVAWKKAVDDFETAIYDDNGDAEPPANPYELPQSGATLRDIELELMREEHERERASPVARDATEETMTEYLMLGLGIEGQQRQLTADLLATRSPTTKDLTDFVTRRTRIARQIKKLRALQRRYSPAALQRAATAVDTEAIEAERTPLFLPSALSASERLPPLSSPGLAAAEMRLRDAQCSESLDHVRHGLIVKRRLQTYRGLNSRHQHQNTRSRSLVDSQQEKVDLGARTYRDARAARIALTPVAEISPWRALEKEDLRLPEDEEEANRKKQRAMKGKRQQAAQLNADGEVRGVPGMGEKKPPHFLDLAGHGLGNWGYWGGDACVREGRMVQGVRAGEMVEGGGASPPRREMARCLLTLEWQAKLWDGRAQAAYYRGKIVYRGSHLQGAIAFAARQAAVRRKLEAGFRRLWWPLTSRIAGPHAPASSESSGVDERDDFAGGGLADAEGSEDSGDESPSEDGRDVAAKAAVVGRSGGEQADREPDDKASDEGDAAAEEDLVTQTAEMDELLAVQSISLGQDDEL
ncbi:CxC2 domain-containing protein [Mycena sanguinolenta]|uniref:CxC2 domain-containing protein n=1 Tax=Mycena sanguinolenta TaxID=230812 RepID=A0A8H6ZD20_9AGAR|nr:CxC2 domain-containing protein [Mycena sanguinolenta]